MTSRTRLLQSSFSTGSLPSLPGMSAAPESYKAKHHKQQRFKISMNGRIEDEEKKSRKIQHADKFTDPEMYQRKAQLIKDYDHMDQQASLRQSASGALALGASASRGSLGTSFSQASLRLPPQWLENDRKVLRFYVYTKEAVHESRTETFRVRKLVVYYYLADNTMTMNEPKENNSGLPQGIFLKRAPHTNPATGEPFHPADFSIGSELNIYSRVCRVVDMDENTREYFRACGYETSPPERYPGDPFAMYKSKSEQRFSVESIVGSKPPDTLGQYLKYDRKVLRFFLLWDDTDTLYGQKNSYVLNYYLTNDEIEIRNVKAANTGADNFPNMLKRTKLPKNSADLEKGFVHWTDLKCGQYLDVYSRHMLVRACDTNTKDFFTENGFPEDHQVDQRIREPQVTPLLHGVPPYNGFGSEEDSLANCLNLVAKPVKQDLYRFLTNSGKVLRFRAKFTEPGPEDVDRRFVITYFMDDDTVAIYEPPQRNSGIVGGKFLERGRYKKRGKGGAEKDGPTELQNMLYEKIHSRMEGGPFGLIRAFKKFGKDGSGQGIDKESFKNGLRSVGFIPQGVTDKTIAQLFDLYDNSGGGLIDFQEFVDHVMMDKPEDARKNTKARWYRAGDFYIGAKADFVFLSGNKTQEFGIYGADDFTLKLMEENPSDFPKSNVEMISMQLATTLAEYNIKVRSIFRAIDSAGNGYITTNQFVTLLKKWAQDFHFVEDELTDQEALTLVRAYDSDGDGKIMYAEFCDALLSKNRPKVEAQAVVMDECKVDGAFATVIAKLEQARDNGIRGEFRALDVDGSGQVTFNELLNLVWKHSIDLNEDEQTLLMAKFDKNGDGYINYQEFCDTLYEFDNPTVDESKEEKFDEELVRVRTPMMKDYKQRLVDAQRLEKAEHDLSLLMKSFTSCFFSRKVTLRKNFLNFDLDQSGYICKDEFEEALNRTNSDFSQDWKSIVLHYFFPSEDYMLQYDDFMAMMFKQDVNEAVACFGSLHDQRSHVDRIRIR